LSTLTRLSGALLRYPYPATVSERLRQASKTVSSGAELIHHKTAAATDRGFELILCKAVTGRSRENPSLHEKHQKTRSDGAVTRLVAKNSAGTPTLG
jgi:hypothetical protein